MSASPFSTAPTIAAGDADNVPAESAHADTPKPTIRTHRVSRGDSLQRIAHRYKLRMADLMALNGLAPRSALRPGMVLKLDRDAGE
jgi:LysM repeat protein